MFISDSLENDFKNKGKLTEPSPQQTTPTENPFKDMFDFFKSVSDSHVSFTIESSSTIDLRNSILEDMSNKKD